MKHIQEQLLRFEGFTLVKINFQSSAACKTLVSNYETTRCRNPAATDMFASARSTLVMEHGLKIDLYVRCTKHVKLLASLQTTVSSAIWYKLLQIDLNFGSYQSNVLSGFRVFGPMMYDRYVGTSR